MTEIIVDFFKVDMVKKKSHLLCSKKNLYLIEISVIRAFNHEYGLPMFYFFTFILTTTHRESKNVIFNYTKQIIIPIIFFILIFQNA